MYGDGACTQGYNNMYMHMYNMYMYCSKQRVRGARVERA